MKKTMKIFLAIMAIMAILNININKEYEDGSLEEMPIYELIEHNSKVKYKKFKMEYSENKRIKSIGKKVRKWEEKVIIFILEKLSLKKNIILNKGKFPYFFMILFGTKQKNKN